MLTNTYFQALLQLDKSSPQFPSQLCGIFDGEEFDERVLDLGTADLVEVIDYLDKVPSLLTPVVTR